MLSEKLPDKARKQFAFAAEKERASMDSATRFGLFFIVLIIGFSTVLPFIIGKRSPGILEAGIYVATTLSAGCVWLCLGYLHGLRVFKDAQAMGAETAGWSNSGWGRPLELLLYFGVFYPLVFAIHVLGQVYFGNTDFNFVLFFILAALACFVQPLWAVPITLCLILGTIYTVNVAFFDYRMNLAHILTMGTGLIFGAMMFFMLNSQIAMRAAAGALTSQLDEANVQLRAYSAKAEELSAMQERNRIAREIHDTLGHSLTVVNVQLEAAKALLPDDVEKASRFIDKAKRLTQQGLQEVRESVSSLRASALDGKTLEQALQELVDDLGDSRIRGSFSLKGESPEISPQIASAVYRTVQEALTNVRKHSQAENAAILLDFSRKSQVKLIVEDDGIGCQNTAGGFGVLGIQERVQFLNGKTSIKTSTGDGFRLEVSIPV